jgi:hypothetical protein
MDKLTPELVALVMTYSKAADAEDIAWEHRHTDGIRAYRQAMRVANAAMQTLHQACYAKKLDVNEVLTYCRSYVGSEFIRLPNGTEIPFGCKTSGMGV